MGYPLKAPRASLFFAISSLTLKSDAQGDGYFQTAAGNFFVTILIYKFYVTEKERNIAS